MAKQKRPAPAQISSLMAEWGRRGGKAAAGKGGKVAMGNLTQDELRERARKAGIASGEARRKRKEERG